MTIDELLAREAIRDVMARYTMAGDRLKVDAFVAVFTEDGVLESDGVPAEDAFRYVGHAQLATWLTRWAEPGARKGRAHAATFVRHHLATSQIELLGDGAARARTYWVAWTDIGADHAGYYLDEFRDTDAGWRIARRRVRLDWRSPDSLFGGAIDATR